MMKLPIIRYADLPPRPWKNGKGITRTLFSDAAEGSGEWTWKISIAEITGTQPYSPYPGVRRGQVALGPGAVDLVLNGQQILLPVEGTIVFEGEDDVSATPRNEGFLDLNVMGLRECWNPAVSIVDSPSLRFEDGVLQVLIALEKSCTLDGAQLSYLDAAQLLEDSPVKTTGKFVVASLTHQHD
ncbi:HutD family protein [Glutamicibacter sp.]|uniref:HutD/Ves family protein n=1 Tax=Glutamicibacter sp. TaxID=1931995 RepID=UPI0028BD4E91|nr:HutD family protein [Glutamicibacter sp.]